MKLIVSVAVEGAVGVSAAFPIAAFLGGRVPRRHLLP